MAYSHPKLKCWVCGAAPATHVVEAKAVVQLAAAFEVESYHQMSCAHTVCLGLSAMWADAADKVHVDTRLIADRGEAEAISGLQLDEAATP